MSMSPLLPALQEFEDLLVSLGFPAHLGMAPGLPEADIRRVSEAVSLPFPQELIDWYTWKNGPDNTTPYSELQITAFGGCWMVEVQHAVSCYTREDTKQVVLDEIEEYAKAYDSPWDPETPEPEQSAYWEVLIDGMGTVQFVDLLIGSEVCPVYGYFKAPHRASSLVVPCLYRSLYDLVNTQTACYKEGAYKVVSDETGLFVEKDDVLCGRIHKAMNPGLRYWEDYTALSEACG